MNFDEFYSTLATIQYFKLWKSAIMEQLRRFVKGSIGKVMLVF